LISTGRRPAPAGGTTKYGSNVIQNFSYNIDPVTGNLNWRKDNSRNIQENFSYDDLNRLTGFGGATIAYDMKGNITDNTAVGSFAYETPAKPYAVKTITPYGTAIPLRNQDVTYNGMQRPATITENGYVAAFGYNDGAERVKMTLTNNGATQLTRYYLGGQYELDAQTGTERLYLGGDAYSAPAVYVKEAGSWNIYYICRDKQGSITHVVNADGYLKQELSYDPWGRLRNPATQQSYALGAEPALFLGRGYTGHEHLQQFGLINMNARLYDPAVGRFLSPDPYVQDPGNSQNYNRYSYCLNNPLKYTDPSGENYLENMLQHGWGFWYRGSYYSSSEDYCNQNLNGIPQGVYYDSFNQNYHNYAGGTVSYDQVYDNYLAPNVVISVDYFWITTSYMNGKNNGNNLAEFNVVSTKVYINKRATETTLDPAKLNSDINKDGVVIHNKNPYTKYWSLKEPYQVAEAMKKAYYAKYGKELNISTGSLGAEIYGHADLYQRGFMVDNTVDANCGLFPKDNNRIVWDALNVINKVPLLPALLVPPFLMPAALGAGLLIDYYFPNK